MQLKSCYFRGCCYRLCCIRDWNQPPCLCLSLIIARFHYRTPSPTCVRCHGNFFVTWRVFFVFPLQSVMENYLDCISNAALYSHSVRHMCYNCVFTCYLYLIYSYTSIYVIDNRWEAWHNECICIFCVGCINSPIFSIQITPLLRIIRHAWVNFIAITMS